MHRLNLTVLSLSALVAACGSSSSSSATGGSDAGPPLHDSGPIPTADASTAPLPSGDDSGSPAEDSGSTSDDAGFVQASHPAWPQLVDLDGVVLLKPKVVTVTFPGDSLAPQLDAFGAQAARSPYWDTIRAGYCESSDPSACVALGPAGTSVALTTAPGPSYTDSPLGGASTLQTYIQGLIADGSIPTPDAQSIVVFYFPATTTITYEGTALCQEILAYHNWMDTTATGGDMFTYAVVPECAVAAGQKLTAIEAATLAASHEIVESATDPFLGLVSLGFFLNFNDPAIFPWLDSLGGEVADLCVDPLGLGQDQYVEDGFVVQRIWNNAAAAAGGDPCVPARTVPYFNTAVEQWLVTEAVGATTTFDADAFSNMPVPGGWTVVGYDLNATSTNANPYLTIKVNGGSSATVNNGDKVSISVTLNQDAAALMAQDYGAVGLLFSYQGSSLETATAGAVWPFLVQSTADAVDAGFGGLDASEDMPVHRPPQHARRLLPRRLGAYAR